MSRFFSISFYCWFFSSSFVESLTHKRSISCTLCSTAANGFLSDWNLVWFTFCSHFLWLFLFTWSSWKFGCTLRIQVFLELLILKNDSCHWQTKWEKNVSNQKIGSKHVCKIRLFKNRNKRKKPSSPSSIKFPFVNAMQHIQMFFSSTFFVFFFFDIFVELNSFRYFFCALAATAVPEADSSSYFFFSFNSFNDTLHDVCFLRL